MAWSIDADSPRRDRSVSAEDEADAFFAQPQPLPWRHKLVRLWRFLTQR